MTASKGSVSPWRRRWRRLGNIIPVVRSTRRNLSMVRDLARRLPGLVLVSRLEHVGDLVASEPVIDAVLQRHPGASVVWLTRQPFAEIYSNHPDVAKVIEVSCLSEAKILGALAGASVPHYDLHEGGRSCHLLGLRFPRRNVPVTCANYYDYGSLLATFSRCAGLDVVRQQPRLYLPSHEGRGLAKRAIVVLHCKSSSASRDWPRVKWIELAEKLTQTLDVDVVEVGLEPVLLPKDRVSPADSRLSLLETAAVIARAALFIGGDSGPAHMANALGVPGVILTGPWKRWVRYQPFSGRYAQGEKAVVLHDDRSVSEIAVDDVWAAAKVLLT